MKSDPTQSSVVIVDVQGPTLEAFVDVENTEE
jgi:hypothetical protein